MIVIWLLGILAVSILVFGLAPLTKYQLESRLSEALEQDLVIQQLKLNPFKGQIELLEVSLGDETRVARLFLDIQVLPLLQQNLVVTEIDIDGIVLPIEQVGLTFKVAGYELPKSDESSKSSSDLGWKITADKVAVRNSTIELLVQGQNHRVALRRVDLGPLSFPDRFETELVAELAIDDAPIRIEASAQVEAGFSSGSFRSGASLSGLELSRYIGLVSRHAVSGVLAFNQKTEGEFSGSTVEVSTSGTLNLNQLQLLGVVNLASAEWQGTVDVTNQGLFTVTGDLAANDFGYLVRQEKTAQISSLAVTGLLFDGTKAAAESVVLDGASGRIERNAQGQLQLGLEQFDSLSSGSQVEPSSPEDAALELMVSEIVLNNGMVEFVDRSTEPLIDLSLFRMNAKVHDFQLSEPFDFVFDAGLSQTPGPSLSIKGGYSVEHQTGVVDIGLNGFELHEIAPYMGNGIKSGRMQLISNIDMKSGHVVVENDVKIKNVKVDERAATAGDQMSLSTALFMLKGTDDIVELDVPFETDFGNFEVGLADIIQTAMLNGARSAAVAYAQYALQPYGSLLFAKDVFGAITKPRFEPVLFESAKSELSSKDHAYVEKMGKFLKSKPDLTVTMCGFAQLSEYPILQPTENPSGENEPAEVQAETVSDVFVLKKLAEERSHIVRDLLMQSGVSEQQLYGCSAAVESNTGQARVELAL